MQKDHSETRKKILYQTIVMIAYHYSWLHGWQCIGAQKRQTKYATNTSCYCKFSSFSHILKCHPQSLPALIHHVNLMSSSRAIHQSLTIALFCSCTHYQRVLAACHKHSVFYSQSGGKGKIYANTKWRIHLSCALSFKSKLVLEMLSYDYEPINVYLKKKKILWVWCDLLKKHFSSLLNQAGC